jgi:outer membrane protein assembly factor BamB
MRTLLWAGMVLGLAAATGLAAPPDKQWGHWRGPLGNGVAPAATPPTEFNGTKNIRWKAAIPGRGSSSPVVWDDSVFVTSAVPVPGSARELDFRIFCFDRQSGAERWSQTAIRATPHEGTHETNGYASASPCTDGKHVYAHFGSQGTFCFTMTGEPVWQRDFGDMHTRNEFGEGSSPTLAGDLLIVPWDHEGPSKLIAVDAATGQTVWETPRDEPTCWATPLITTDSRGRQQVVMNGQNAARGYDLATGGELWRCSGQTVRPCASAVAADGIAYIGSGFRGSFLGAFDLAGDGDLAGGTHVLWTRTQQTPDVASPLLSQGRLYYYKEKTGLLSCIDAASGTPHYETRRLPGMSRTYASPVAADGHVYLTDRSGRIVVIKDAPSLEVVAENDMGEGVDATPAPVGDALFIRGEQHLFCIGQALNFHKIAE